MSVTPTFYPLQADQVTASEKDHIVALANQQLAAALESLPQHMRRPFIDCMAVLCIQLMHSAYGPEYAANFMQIGLNEYAHPITDHSEAAHAC